MNTYLEKCGLTMVDVNMTNTSVPKRTENDFIQSAGATALMRSLLSFKKGILNNPDHIARYFVPEQWECFFSNPDIGIKDVENILPGGIYYHLARTKYIDNILLSWLETHSNGQVLNMASGLDSRSIRFNKELDDTKIYELDLKAMHDYKNKVIESIEGINNNTNVSSIPVNFHVDSLVEKYNQYNIDKDKNTLIILEGITYFLEKETNSKILNSFKDYFNGNVNIVFDYAYHDYIDGYHGYYGAHELYRELIKINEPHVFGIDNSKVDVFLSTYGFKLIENCTSKELENRYLVEDNVLLHKMHEFHGFCYCSN